MAERVPANTWVEVRAILLQPGARAQQAPEDTRQVALEMKVKGFLRHVAAIGEQAEIVTAAGRMLKGVLSTINPAYTHQFGAPIPELLPIGGEVRAILREQHERER